MVASTVPDDRGALRVWDATAMAVGGMIGGGIFTVLGVAIALAGHLAAACFVLGMVLSLATARSYAGIARRAGRSGGPIEHLRADGRTALAGNLVWILVVGYVAVMGVYSFTFGRYAAEAVGGSVATARFFSVLIVVVFLAVNARGVVLSKRTEDVIVAAKLLILGTIAVIGTAHVSAHRLAPVADKGWGGLILGAATVFVAYEGFELISYDRDDMVDPERTMPRALYLSVAIVAFIYIFVTLGAQMLVSDSTIVSQREIAFTTVGRAALGSAGRWVAIVGAVLATGSAINATIFSAARLIRDAGTAGELPPSVTRERAGQPFVALAIISIGGAAMAMLPGLTEVISFASAAFLVVYALVNFLEATIVTNPRDRAIALGAMVCCVGALVALVVELAQHDRGGLVLLAALSGTVVAARGWFVRSRAPATSP